MINKSQPRYFIYDPMAQEEIETLDNLSFFMCDQIKWQHTSLLSHMYLQNIPAVQALPRPIQFRESIGKLRIMAQVQNFKGILVLKKNKQPGVAFPWYLSRILNFTDSGSRIQQQHEKRGEKICCPTFSCSLKFYKTENYIIFEYYVGVPRRLYFPALQ